MCQCCDFCPLTYHGRVWRLVYPAGDVDSASLVRQDPGVVTRYEHD